MRYFLDISYDGTDFHGWQRQSNSVSVQETLEEAISTILEEKTAVTGSGRTDAGVHARQQVAHFDCSKKVDKQHLTFRLNSFLPSAISVNSVKGVKDDASARFDAISRCYHYYIHQRKDPFSRDYSHFFHGELNVTPILEACQIIKSWQNFECFSKVHTEVNHFKCLIFDANWKQVGDQHLFSIAANRFLRGMVRAVVGTLLDVGMGKTSVAHFRKILESNDRREAGSAVPAKGLFLNQVRYPSEIFTIS
ncbi:MAG: tRNA pseudouridine(38-40) synthase TruA [Bacteroidota bacterium]